MAAFERVFSALFNPAGTKFELHISDHRAVLSCRMNVLQQVSQVSSTDVATKLLIRCSVAIPPLQATARLAVKHVLGGRTNGRTPAAAASRNYSESSYDPSAWHIEPFDPSRHTKPVFRTLTSLTVYDRSPVFFPRKLAPSPPSAGTDGHDTNTGAVAWDSQSTAFWSARSTDTDDIYGTAESSAVLSHIFEEPRGATEIFNGPDEFSEPAQSVPPVLYSGTSPEEILHESDAHGNQEASTGCMLPFPVPYGQPEVVKFELMGRIGKGAFGRVMLARRYTEVDGNVYQDEVALKVLKKAVQYRHKWGRSHAIKEYNILRWFNPADNRHLTSLLMSWHDRENIYLAMELYPESLGHRLRTLWREYERVDSEEARLYCAELLIGLDFMHNDMGIVHCDLKPDNIFIAADGRLVIGDFGMAYYADQDVKTCTFTGRFGTRGYLAPEVCCPRPEDAPPAEYTYKVDIFSMGLVFGEILGLSSPLYAQRIYDDDGNRLDYDQWTEMQKRPVEEVLQELVLDSKAARDLLTQMLRMDPQDRPTAMTLSIHPYFDRLDIVAVSRGAVRHHYKPGRPYVDEREKGIRFTEPLKSTMDWEDNVETQMLEDVDSKEFYYYPIPPISIDYADSKDDDSPGVGVQVPQADPPDVDMGWA